MIVQENRMSCIWKEIESDEIIMYMKGADSIMMPRLLLLDQEQNKLEEDLSAFAKKGLRTLVFGK